jgi:hypothetical protein
MIRMVDKDGDGQVSFEEFYEMVTGGKAPPAGLWDGPGAGVVQPGLAAAGNSDDGPVGAACICVARPVCVVGCFFCVCVSKVPPGWAPCMVCL